jgi:D-alanyl-D-alanine carboxypeptidase-like protein
MAEFRALLIELSAHADIADSEDLRALASSASGHRPGDPVDVIDPVELLKGASLPGDVLVRRAPAEGIEYLAVIVGDYVATAESFAARGVTVETAGPGLYVEIAEVPFEGGAVEFSARRVTDARGRGPRGQTIHRPQGVRPAPIIYDDDDDWLFESEELARHAAFAAVEAWPDRLALAEANQSSGRPRLLTSARLRQAWSAYECADQRMTPLRLFGWDTPVNPETVDAWRVLEPVLLAAGYEPHRAWVYNCRQIAGQQTRSLHAYGLAIDIDHTDPTCNVNRPTPDGREVRFSAGATKDERCHDVRRGVADTSFTAEQIAAIEAIQTVDDHQVFAWGGRWRTTKDTMHFQINVTPAELARGIRTQSSPPYPAPMFDNTMSEQLGSGRDANKRRAVIIGHVGGKSAAKLGEGDLAFTGLTEDTPGDCQNRTAPTLNAHPAQGMPRVGRTGLSIVLRDPIKLTGSNLLAEVQSISAGTLMGSHFNPNNAALVLCEAAISWTNATAGQELEMLSFEPVDDGVKLALAIRSKGWLRGLDDLMLRRLEHAAALEYAWDNVLGVTYDQWKATWLSKTLFTEFCWQQGRLVESLRAALYDKLAPLPVNVPQQTDYERKFSATSELWQSLNPGGDLLWRIASGRADVPRGEAYRQLFPSSGDPTRARGRFLNVCAGRFHDLAKRALEDAVSNRYETLQELLRRFEEDLKVLAMFNAASATGDDALHYGILKANAPPFPSWIRTALDNQRQEDQTLVLPTKAFLECEMHVEFATVWDTFPAQYYWTVYRLQSGDIPIETTYGKKTEVLEAKLGREWEHSEVDAERVNRDRPLIGMTPWGLGALRVAGTAVSEVLLRYHKAWEREIVLPDRGRYRIECVMAYPYPEDQGALMRAPSVATVDCVVTDGKTMSEQRATDAFLDDASAMVEVEELFRTQLEQLNLVISGKPSDLIEPTAEGKKEAGARVREINEILQRRKESLKSFGARSRPFRLIASLVLEDGGMLALTLEAVEVVDASTVRVIVIDSSMRDGRQETHTGRDRREAVVGALRVLLEKSEHYGRGYCTVIIPLADDDADFHRQTFRVNRDADLVLTEFTEKLSMLVSILALVAAPFTGGASLALMIPFGFVGMVPSIYRMADRHTQGTLRWDLQTALDLLDVVSSFAGLGEGVAGIRFVRLRNGFSIVGRGARYGQVLLGTEQFLREIEAISKDKTLMPAQKRFALAMAIGNKLLSEGISAGHGLIHHAISVTPPKEHPLDLMLERVTAPEGVAADVFQRQKESLKSIRKVDAARMELPRHLRAELGFAEAVRKTAGADVAVFRDEKLAGRSAEVRFELDRFGFIDSVYIALGKDADLTQIHSHARTAGRILSYTTLAGRLKTVFFRALALVTGDQRLNVGRSAAWESVLELRKLREQLNDHLYALAQHERGLTPAVMDEYAAGLEEQIREHEMRLLSTDPASGVVAAQDRRKIVSTLTAELHASAEKEVRRLNPTASVTVKVFPEPPPGQEQSVSVRRTGKNSYEIALPKRMQGIPDEVELVRAYIRRHFELSLKKNRTAAEEAEYAGYPQPEPGYKWVVDRDRQKVRFRYEPEGAEPPRVYNESTGVFQDRLKYMDLNGELTADGIALVRQKFPNLASASDDAIRQELRNRGTPFETMFFAEHEYDLKRMRSNRFWTYFKEAGTRPNVGSILRDLLGRLGVRGKTLSSKLAMLNMTLKEFIDSDPVLSRMAQDRMRNPEVADFYNRASTIGRLEPDLFEFDLQKMRGYVLDVSLAYENPAHNFKTLVYRAVLERLIGEGCSVYSLDYRSIRRARPI